MMQDQKWLKFRGHSSFGGGSDIVTTIIAHTGSQYVDYGITPFHSLWGIEDATPKIVDIPLTLIVRMC